MGRTAFSGPAYGAKCLLAIAHKESIAASVTNLEIFQVDIPAGEDWLITNVSAYCDVQGNGGTCRVLDDGVSIAGTITLVSDDAVEAVITKDAAEDEGKAVAAGSVLTVDATNGATTVIEDITVSIWGFIRKVGL